MAATSNTFEGLSNGTGITSGNSGGASGDAFDLMTLGSGATATADTSKSAHGSVSMKLATGVSAADCVAEWTTKIGSQTTIFTRMYLWIPSNPGTNHRLFDMVASPNLCGALYLSTTGKVEAVDTGGGQMTITTTSVALSQWIRIEAKYIASTTVGQAEIRLYNSADSTTADETKVSAASFNTQASFNEFRFGAAGDPMPANRTVWYDDIALSTVAFLGPSGTGALAPLLKPGRTWRRRFKHRQTLFAPVSSGPTTFNQNLSGSITPTGALVKQTQKPLGGAVTPTGALTKQTQRTLTGSVTPTSSLAISLVKLISLAGSITPSGALIKQVQKLLGGGITPTGALLKQVNKRLTGSITPTGAVANIKTILLSLAGSIVPTGTLVKQDRKTLTGPVTPTGALVKQDNKRVTGSITPTGAAATTRVVLLAVAGAITPAGVVVKRAGKALSGALSPSGAVLKRLSRLLGGSVTPTGASSQLLGSLPTLGTAHAAVGAAPTASAGTAGTPTATAATGTAPTASAAAAGAPSATAASMTVPTATGA